jgi:hypothetical protein
MIILTVIVLKILILGSKILLFFIQYFFSSAHEIYHWIKMNLFFMIKLYRISSYTINASCDCSSSSLKKILYCLYETMIVDLIVNCFLFARDKIRLNLDKYILSVLMHFRIINYRKDELQSDYNFFCTVVYTCERQGSRDKCAVNKIMPALISRRVIYNRICHGQRARLHARLSRELCV